MSEVRLCQLTISTSGLRLSILENAEEVAHLFIYFLRNDLHAQPFALAEDLYVVEWARGKGYGSKLLEHASDLARRHGCYKIIGTIRHSRADLHSYYADRGWHNHGICVRIDFEQ